MAGASEHSLWIISLNSQSSTSLMLFPMRKLKLREVTETLDSKFILLTALSLPTPPILLLPVVAKGSGAVS